ncbi:hypothetical protein B0H13DRAFT_1905236 [Mycena leptocephala]|nr:hypothetical protein B0H13DRAFT_1905236 [Mycena leptocephala]
MRCKWMEMCGPAVEDGDGNVRAFSRAEMRELGQSRSSSRSQCGGAAVLATQMGSAEFMGVVVVMLEAMLEVVVLEFVQFEERCADAVLVRIVSAVGADADNYGQACAPSSNTPPLPSITSHARDTSFPPPPWIPKTGALATLLQSTDQDIETIKRWLRLEPVRRTARPSKKTAVSGYGRVNPSRRLDSEIEKRTGPTRPARTRPFRRVMMDPQIIPLTLRKPAYIKYLTTTNKSHLQPASIRNASDDGAGPKLTE